LLYHLLVPLANTHIIFNLFTYISFRAAGSTVTALLVAFIFGPPIIRWLRDRNVGQVIRAEGPASHQGKRGTPTMGGIIIILATVVATLLWARLDSRYVVVAIIATLWMGAIGMLDDYLKIVRGKSQGLVARWKLAGQISFGLGLGLILLLWPLADNLSAASTQVPLLKYYLLTFWPPLYVLFVTVVLTGSSNAVNLTDGLDGLASGLTAISAGAFAVFAYLFGRFDASRYLGVYFLPGAGELTIFCGALLGAALGFLWFNAHPAQVFMGDTGAQALSVGIVVVAFMTGWWLLLPVIGIIFVLEGASDVLQIGHYKLKGTRILRRAPIHYHFQLGGWPETVVVARFWLIGLLGAFAGVALAYVD